MRLRTCRVSGRCSTASAWDVKSLPPEYGALAAKVDAAISALDDLGDNPTPAQIFDVFDKVNTLYTALKAITNAPEGVNAAEFFHEIGRSLFELLLFDYLDEAMPNVHSALLALGIITQRYVEETDSRPGVVVTRFQWEEIPKVITDPASIPDRVYGWGTDDMDFHRLAGHLLEFFIALDWPAYIGRVEAKLGRGFLDSSEGFRHVDRVGPEAPCGAGQYRRQGSRGRPRAAGTSAAGRQAAGLIIQPLIPSDIGTSYDISDALKIELRAGSDVAQTFGVLLRPGDISVKFPFQEGATLPTAGFGVTLRYAPASPTLLLGTPSTRLSLKVAATIHLDTRDGRGGEGRPGAEWVGTCARRAGPGWLPGHTVRRPGHDGSDPADHPVVEPQRHLVRGHRSGELAQHT